MHDARGLLFSALWLFAACGGDDSNTDEPSGSGGSSGSGAGGSGNAMGSGAASGSGTSGSSSGGDGQGGEGATCSTPEPEACDWQDFDGLDCGDESCCGSERACSGERCLALCGLPLADVGKNLADDVEVLAQVCAYGMDLVLRSDGDCQQPVLYTVASPYDAGAAELTIEVLRSFPSPRAPMPPLESARLTTWTPTLPGPAYLNSFVRVNPSETKAVFSALHGELADAAIDLENSLLELDLESGAIRSIEGLGIGPAFWLDDERLLVHSLTLGSTTQQDEGIYLVDTSGADLEYTFVVGYFQGGPLGVIGDGEYLLTGGVPIIGGIPPSLAVVPMSAIADVVSGSRTAIDVHADSDVMLIERDAWELQGSVLDGRWFVSPADAQYTAYRSESLLVTDGVFSFGPEKVLIPDASTFVGALYAGQDRLLIFTDGKGEIVAGP